MFLRALVVSLLCHLVLFSSWFIPEREVLTVGAPGANLQLVLVSGINNVAVSSGRPDRSAHRQAKRGSGAEQNKLALNDGKVTPSSHRQAAMSSVRETGDGRPAASTQAAIIGGELAAVLPDGEQHASSVTAETPSLDLLRQYRLALAREARRHKRYPALARTRGWEGLVTIGIHVPLPGATPQLSIAEGSGVEYLDTLALEMITLSVRAVDLPEGLKGRAFVIEVPVRYALEE